MGVQAGGTHPEDAQSTGTISPFNLPHCVGQETEERRGDKEGPAGEGLRRRGGARANPAPVPQAPPRPPPSSTSALSALPPPGLPGTALTARSPSSPAWPHPPASAPNPGTCSHRQGW